jgi:hypothetical protein
MAELIKLADGFAYCEVRSVYNITVDMKPMVDKNGCPMISIHWSVVDCKGDIGTIKSYISSKLKQVITNLENALGINAHIFDERIKQFNCDLIRNRCCAAVIKFDDKYGSKIEKYVPLEFFNHLNNKDSDKVKAYTQKKEATYTGVKKSDAQRLLEERGINFDKDDNVGFDYIPF